MKDILKINKSLFWDTDIDTIDPEKNSVFIIARVLMRGDIDDWREIKRYYGIERMREDIKKIRYLDKRTLNFCSWYFNIPLGEFKCFSIPQSYRKLWDY